MIKSEFKLVFFISLQLQNETIVLTKQINTDLKQLKEISLGNEVDQVKLKCEENEKFNE